ncbi:MAG: aldolase [Candidatus Hodarchaeota archaeon]
MSEIDVEIYQEFKKYGKFLREHGLISSHGGNISLKRGNNIYIKRTGAMLGDLKPNDVVKTDLYKEDSKILLASKELPVHRNILLNTGALAVIHAHPPYSIVLSFLYDEIIPIDIEGSYIVKKIPVIQLEVATASDESATKVPQVLQDYKVMIIRGHGTFAHGSSLEEAYMWTTVAESVCHLVYLAKKIGIDVEKEGLRNW